MQPRALVSDVTIVLSAQLSRELRNVAGANTLVSRAEQRTADPVVSAAADEVRAEGGAGSRVTVAALTQKLTAKALALIGAENQTSGPGALLLSRAEAVRTLARDRGVGLRVLTAYEITMGRGLDVDALARNKVSAPVVDPDQTFKEFATEGEAVRYQDPDGKSVTWLVRTDASLLSASYVWGRNDLWAERFTVDKLDGTFTTTAEH